ncbi:MAG: hypothetical protein M3471_06505 [Actinomycetota bacterium]|nr:hypothetical protein [Actinomycetota bacterium]
MARSAVEPALIRRVMGDTLAAVAVAGPAPPTSWLQGRLSGFTTTWLLPDYQVGWHLAAGFVGVVSLAAASVLARRGLGTSTALVRALAGVAAAGIMLRATGGGLVPGLLVACPLLIGVVGIDQVAWRSPALRLGIVAWSGFALAVLATQYSQGGSGEWGGRYFAIGLPLVVPVAVAGWRRLLSGLDRRTAVTLGGALAVCSLAIAGAGLRTMHDSRESVGASVDELLAARLRATGGAGATPPVLATLGRTARFAWAEIDDGTWMTVASEDLGRYADRLLAASAGPVVLVSGSPDADESALEDRWEVEWLDSRYEAIAILTPRP